MYQSRNILRKILNATLVLMMIVSTIPAQQASVTVGGQVIDELGGVITKVVVTLIDAQNNEKNATTDEAGNFAFTGVQPGKYTIRIIAKGFAFFENEIEATAGAREPIKIKLSPTIEAQKEVTVTANSELGTDPENNASTVVLGKAEIETLPDDPDEMAAALRALAGPSNGPNGGQIYIDGFTAEGRLPPKSSIREIRINQNPFTAEFEKLGFGRIQITTRPGTNKFHGQGMLHFNDESLNTRNPFAPTRSPFQLRYYTGVISGPLIGTRSSFFANFQRREIDDNAFINATVLDPSFNISPISHAVVAPRRETFASARVDYQFNQNHTLLGQYVYTPSRLNNSGIGDFSLESRALTSSEDPHTFRVTETSILNSSVVNETRFQIVTLSRKVRGDSSLPTVNVLDAFTGGGAAVAFSSNSGNLWELHNYTTWAMGTHTLRFGGRFRSARVTDISPSNFNGTFLFAGGVAPELDHSNRAVFGANNEPVMVPINSIERYRRTVMFQEQGLSPAEIRALGGGATQFSIAGGNPSASVSQRDVGVFAQEDWRMRPNFTLSLGLRYEVQNNINSNLNFAPRVAFAWSPAQSGNRAPKVVLRGGFGVFFDRIPATLTLQADRYNGINQQQFITSDPSALDLFPNAPSVELLEAFAAPQTIRRLAGDMKAPYTTQAAFSVEQQLPLKIGLTTTYIYARALHILRTRNINAPLPGTFVPGDPDSGIRPFGNVGNIFAFESSGVFKQHQVIVNFSKPLSNRLSVFATYALNKADSDTDGIVNFPANTYDLTGEYGHSSLDIRHRLNTGASYDTIWGLNLNTLIVWRSGVPFNIITGRDTNGDTIFAERPAFATDLSKPGVVVTRFGAFDPNPEPGQAIIPRNFAKGPSFMGVNLGISKTISLGSSPKPAAAARSGATPAARAEDKPYKLTFAIRSYNLFNRNNLGSPVGNLSSPIFGHSNSTSAESGTNNATSNRRIWLHVSFSF